MMWTLAQSAFMALGLLLLMARTSFLKTRQETFESVTHERFKIVQAKLSFLQKDYNSVKAKLDAIQNAPSRTFKKNADAQIAKLKEKVKMKATPKLEEKKQPATSKKTPAKPNPAPAPQSHEEKVEQIKRKIQPAFDSYLTPSSSKTHFTDTVISQLIMNAVSNASIDVFAQPVQTLPYETVRYYEMFARLRARDGVYIPANQYMSIAEHNEMDAQIDLLLLKKCLTTIEASKDLDRATPFFININTSILKDQKYMAVLLNFLSKHRALAGRIIFEIKQKDYKNISPKMLKLLQAVSMLGCEFSLDHVTDLDFNISTLAHHKVKFVKISARTLIYTDQNEILGLKNSLERNGITVIAEKVETPATLEALLDLDVRYAQGYTLGHPDLKKMVA